MNYYELIFITTGSEDYQQDLLINTLAEIGFDTFEETGSGFKAYIPEGRFDRGKLDEELLVYRQMFPLNFVVNLIPQKNWNEVWESNFEPITVGDKIHVRATFHQPKSEYPYELVIDPKMAFGTGHHQTTSMMLQLMTETDFFGKKVLDMGCGTGILAIMARKLGASNVTAIDYDPVCCASTIENTLLNHEANISVLCGSKEVIPNERFDTILANINRNILLDQIPSYAGALNEGGELYLSGFYEAADLGIITSEATKYGLKYAHHKTENDWAAVKFIR